MEMVIANRFRRNDRVLVPTNGKFGERVAHMCDECCNLKHMKYEWGRAIFTKWKQNWKKESMKR